LRERFFGGRPPLIFTDLKTINELRRIGGLLRHNFETLRQAKATQDICALQAAALRQLLLTSEKIASAVAIQPPPSKGQRPLASRPHGALPLACQTTEKTYFRYYAS